MGIGLNPKAEISRTVLEDEKVLKTCHLAIGKNYDEDAPAMIHLDGVVHKPTITVYTRGKKRVILDNGDLKI